MGHLVVLVQNSPKGSALMVFLLECGWRVVVAVVVAVLWCGGCHDRLLSLSHMRDTSGTACFGVLS